MNASPGVFIIIGICGMIALSIGLIYFVILHQRRVFQYHIETLHAQKQHELQIQIIAQETQEQTMSQLASELHDDVGVTLSSVKLFLSKSGNNNPELIKQSQDLLDYSIQKIRNLSHQLHPATLQHLGLGIAVQSLLDVIGKSGVTKTALRDNTGADRLPEPMELSLFRIIQELLNNLLKHSAATEIDIDLQIENDCYTVGIHHNGSGLDNEQYQTEILKKGAIGLKSMYNRLQLLQAHISFDPIPDAGYHISISIPLNQSS